MTDASGGEREHRLRHRGPRFVSIPVVLLEDGRLSGNARTLGAWIASRPDGWKFYPEYIKRQLSLGKDAYQTAKRQLVDAGWLVTEIVREGGRYASPEWTFCFDHEPPAGPVEATGAGKPGSGSAGDGDSAGIYRSKGSKCARARRPVDKSILYAPLPKGDPGHRPVPRPRDGDTRVPPPAGG